MKKKKFAVILAGLCLLVSSPYASAVEDEAKVVQPPVGPEQCLKVCFDSEWNWCRCLFIKGHTGPCGGWD